MAELAMHIILDALVRLLSPVLCFTAEEIWQAMPHNAGDDTYSVLFNDMPKNVEEYNDEKLGEKYELIRKIRTMSARRSKSQERTR